MTITEIYKYFQKCKGISTDTRKIEPDCFFVALKGEKFDANSFAKEALEKGAKYVVIDNASYFIDERTILVPNSLETLQSLATFHRDSLGLKIIALTGSNGKTTTKELIHSVLSQKFKTQATFGNLNNHIGVPLTLLNLTQDTEIGIIEMGANHQKEIDFLCKIAKPDYGYITNFGKAHLEGFGGVEGVIKGKSELFNYLAEHQKLFFINDDDPIQVQKSFQQKKYSFSKENPSSNVHITAIDTSPFVTVLFNALEIHSHLIGSYNATNIMAAITIGHYFGIENELIKKGIESYIPQNNRSQIIHLHTNEIILDAYNANPSSMDAAIQNFVNLKKSKKIGYLGDMFELGKESFDEHKKIVEKIKELPEIKWVLIGREFYNHHFTTNHISFYETTSDFFEKFNATPEDSLILIKGSRGMALEKIVEHMK